MNGGDWAQLLTLRDVMKTAYKRGGDRLMSVWERDLNAIEAAIALLDPASQPPAAPVETAEIEEDDPEVLIAAKAIAEHGFGRPWDDFFVANAFDTDQGDLIEYGRAAVAALRSQSRSSAGTAQELERVIRSLLRNHSSPTVGRGDVHGGQAGYILYEPGLSFVVAGIRRHLSSAQPQRGQDTRHGIYIASKVKHADRWRFMRDKVGEPIVSTWIDEAGEGETSDHHDLWRRCLSEASNCALLVVYREPDEVLKGAWVELGAALTNDVPVFAVGLEEYTIAKYRGIRHFKTMKEAMTESRKLLASSPLSRPESK